MNLTIKVPATSANLGPGFDSLGLALDLWNESVFEVAEASSVYIEGEGNGRVSQGRNNLILRAAQALADQVQKDLPPLIVRCVNRIPFGSGLGSSAAATLAGLLAANVLTGSPLAKLEILNLATRLESHPDNVAPALMGGLVVSTVEEGQVLARKLPIAPLQITVVVPEFRFPTRQARKALPHRVKMKEAVHNISRAVLLTEAFRTGDMNLLAEAMTDVLHQPYRIPQIPGAQAAMQAMRSQGAAVALSGAGPSLIAFSANRETATGEAAKRAFEQAGLQARILELKVSSHGADIHT
jgi:homoserine kinase